MTTFHTTEKYVSQVPAMQALIAFGYTPLSQAETEKKRGKLHRVLLEDVLAEQILRINRFTSRGEEHSFSAGDAEEAIRRLKPSPIEQRGLVRTNQDIYDSLILGTTIEKTIDGDRKSYSLRYIDWNTPENNAYHATVEVTVERTGSALTRRCDIVLFVNGIPLVVIENKSPTESITQAISQHIRNQGADEIPHLFHYAQLDKDETIHALVNRPLTDTAKTALFSGDFAPARRFFDQMQTEGTRAVTEQDRVLYALCRPERLLELIRNFCVFDSGVKKLGRYQQFFGVRETLRRLKQFDHEGRRRGGVIWHTQGSGKSLTMVMLGKALAQDPDITNARIIIATDRDDLDKQIKDTFKSCQLEPVRATSGTQLIELIQQKKPLITTIINKFYAAGQSRVFFDNDPNVFVLVDESHRTQTGKNKGFSGFGVMMRRILPKACYIGFTGTPLLKDEKSTLDTFGGLIHKYTIDDAVRDGAVVPLLYEGRYIEQKLSGQVIDEWFDRVAKGLTDEQKADLKSKFSRMSMLAKTEQAIYAKAIDISEHFRQSWQGTGRKAQLVAPSKSAAIRFKDIRDEFYAALREFSKCLHTALSSEKTTKELDAFKADWKRFTNLKRSVQIRYQEVVDIKEYEPKIQKLLDDHIIATPAQIIVTEVNINDPSALEAVIAEQGVTAASKADRIASATKKTITERMEEDPTLYKAFSQMLEEAIREYRSKRISEKDYLKRVSEIAKDVASGKRAENIPTKIQDNLDAQAFYGALLPTIKLHLPEGTSAEATAAEISLAALSIIKKHLIVNIWQNPDAMKKIQNTLDDYFFDVVGPEMAVSLTPDELDKVLESLMAIARARFPGCSARQRTLQSPPKSSLGTLS